MRTRAPRASRHSRVCRTARQLHRVALSPRKACRPGRKKNSLERRGVVIVLQILLRRVVEKQPVCDADLRRVEKDEKDTGRADSRAASLAGASSEFRSYS